MKIHSVETVREVRKNKRGSHDFRKNENRYRKAE